MTAFEDTVALRTAFQMDPIDRIDIRGDSTFALMLEAQARGHSLFYYTPDRLIFSDGRILATGFDVTVRDVEGDHYTLSEERRVELSGFDVIHLRQDPPFDMAYITTTFMLEQLVPDVLVVNDPANVRNAPEKLFSMSYPELMPPTAIVRDLDGVRRFRAEHEDIILKPLYGNGGAAVFRLAAGDTNLGSLVELFQGVFREPFVVQKYLPQVRAGDKRILLVDGEPAGAINRVPADDETRSNMHIGGRAEPTEMTGRDLEICAAIGPELKRRRLALAGIDVIGDYLTEVNVTSPTGLRELKRFGGTDVAARLWDWIEATRAGRT
ncbi:MAG: glutathione synthase [Dichotomicrobium sp.]